MKFTLFLMCIVHYKLIKQSLRMTVSYFQLRRADLKPILDR